MKKESLTRQRINIVTIAFAVVLFWRGIWGLMDIYLFPNNKTISFVISAILGLVILMLTKKTAVLI